MSGQIKVEVEVRRTGQGGAYGPWVAQHEAPHAVVEAAVDEAVEQDADEGEVEVGGQAWAWRRI